MEVFVKLCVIERVYNCGDECYVVVLVWFIVQIDVIDVCIWVVDCSGCCFDVVLVVVVSNGNVGCVYQVFVIYYY